MQLAILLVLILIAVLIAPWLIGVAIALAAAYGIYLVVSVAIAGAVVALIVMWTLLTGGGRRGKSSEAKERYSPTPERQRDQRRCIEAAIATRKADQLHRHEQTRAARIEIHGERKACKFCQVETAASESHCKNCGNLST